MTNLKSNTRDKSQDLRVFHLAAKLNELTDVDLLLMQILQDSRGLVGAEAGSIYIKRGNKLILASSQNDYLERIVGEREDLPFINYSLELNHHSLAGHVALEQKTLTINDTSEIDPDAPFQHFTAIDKSTNYICQAIMTIALRGQNGESLGVVQLINPLDKSGKIVNFTSEDEDVATLYAYFASLALEKAMMLRSLTIRSIEVVSAHDPLETLAHTQRVACLAAELYELWSMKNRVPSDERLMILNLFPLAAMLHDIGKMSIPKPILTKPGRLDHQERAIMEAHVLNGARLFRAPRTPLDHLVYQVILDHHERWDGQGYPGWVDIETGEPLPGHLGEGGRVIGKKGEEISIFGRILAVADVYDALITRRPYKDSFDESLSIQIMEQESGHHFDPQVIECLLARRSVLKRIWERFPDTLEQDEMTREPPLARAPLAYPVSN
ncbi:MAG: HD domain-containing protein [Deltaproteobacteria bacterium]|nr:HD domain-containing protein [Deltaproteobacteria bacterium]